MAAEFTTPTFLEPYSVDGIYQQMVDVLPSDIDTSQGSHVYNLTYPTALVLSELCEYVLPQVIQLIFPQWSYGEYLDAHAETRGMTRKAATAATGEITITGIAGTFIPAGSAFSTASLNQDDPSITYDTLEAVTIPSSGSVTVDVECEQTGTVGNAAANTVIIVSSTITGISGVTNAEPMIGGTDEETDEALIARIVEYDVSQGDSFTGNVSDYKRWALSVAGVGSALVIPANDDTGLVTIVITDSNGAPATESLCNTVYNYIMQPDNPDARLAPVNAFLQVAAPTIVDIGIQATVELVADYELSTVEAAFLTNVASYLSEALSDGEIKITRVEAILSATEGINDFTALQIGIVGTSSTTYSSSNIALTGYQIPQIVAGDLDLTEGDVSTHGNTSVTATDDGAGHVTINGATATTDGSGNVTLST